MSNDSENLSPENKEFLAKMDDIRKKKNEIAKASDLMNRVQQKMPIHVVREKAQEIDRRMKLIRNIIIAALAAVIVIVGMMLLLSNDEETTQQAAPTAVADTVKSTVIIFAPQEVNKQIEVHLDNFIGDSASFYNLHIYTSGHDDTIINPDKQYVLEKLKKEMQTAKKEKFERINSQLQPISDKNNTRILLIGLNKFNKKEEDKALKAKDEKDIEAMQQDSILHKMLKELSNNKQKEIYILGSFKNVFNYDLVLAKTFKNKNIKYKTLTMD